MEHRNTFHGMFRGLAALWLIMAIGLCGCQKSPEQGQDDQKTQGVDRVDYDTLSEDELEVLAYDNDLQAQIKLANRYDYGTVEKGQDFHLAFTWYQKAAENGSPEAMTALGYLYLNGMTGESDKETAITCFEEALQAGYTDAAIGIARTYLSGYRGEEQEEDVNTVVFRYVSQAYEKKTVQGVYYMAYCLEEGMGTETDTDKAIALYQQVVEEKDLSIYDAYLPNAAYTRLGMIYAKGKGGKQDYELAREAFKKAADDGYAMAQYYLGMLYENGLGMDRDHATAYEWYKKAADQNYAPALNQIGYLYYNGYGVDADMEQALYYQKLAAMQGYAAAQVNLGYLYENGIGVEKNLKTALAYYQLAAAQEQEGAKEAVQRVSRLLNEEE